MVLNARPIQPVLAARALAALVRDPQEQPGRGVPGIVAEACRRGRAALPMQAAEWEALLAERVDLLRDRFGIPPAPRYERWMTGK